MAPVILGLALAALALGDVAATPPRPTWPWGGTLTLKTCGTGERIEESSSTYARLAPKVIAGLATGLGCLEANPSTPKRAEGLRKWLDQNTDHVLFFLCTDEEMNSSRDANACGASRAVFGGALIQFHLFVENPSRCGCVEATVYHELLHVTSSGKAECPPYRCAKSCFECAVPVPRYPGGGEDCDRVPSCCDP